MRLFKFVLTLFFIVTLGACSHMEVSTYAKEKPELRLEDYFKGTLTGHGLFMDRGGEVKRRFVVVITGTVSSAAAPNDTIVLDEQFTWSDGVKDSRVWTLKKQANGQWHGTAFDVIGHAVGTVAGNALNWRYVLALPVDGKTYHVNFDDWMYLIDHTVMMNKAVMSKFGLRLGEVLISFTKQKT